MGNCAIADLRYAKKDSISPDLEKTNSMNFVGLNFFFRQIGPFFRQFGILECENKK